MESSPENTFVIEQPMAQVPEAIMEVAEAIPLSNRERMMHEADEAGAAFIRGIRAQAPLR